MLALKRISINIDLPKFRNTPSQPWVPKESQLDRLIASAGLKTATFLQLLKETGARTIEATRIQWVDIDHQAQIVTVRNPAKGGLPRQIKASENLMQMLSRLARTGDYVFGETPKRIQERIRMNYHYARLRVANKTADKDLPRIRLHTFRHFYATKLYPQTHHIRYVQEKLGHRSITGTTTYENSEPNQDLETYIVKAVTDR